MSVPCFAAPKGMPQARSVKQNGRSRKKAIKQIAMLVGLATVLNVPGFIKLCAFFSDVHGLALMGLAFGYALYVVWAFCYAIYFSLIFRFFGIGVK